MAFAYSQPDLDIRRAEQLTGTVIGWAVVDTRYRGVNIEEGFLTRDDAETEAARIDPTDDNGDRAGRFSVVALVEPGD